MPTRARLGARLVVTLILDVFPETHEHLDTTPFVCIVMALFEFVTDAAGRCWWAAQRYSSLRELERMKSASEIPKNLKSLASSFEDMNEQVTGAILPKSGHAATTITAEARTAGC